MAISDYRETKKKDYFNIRVEFPFYKKDIEDQSEQAGDKEEKASKSLYAAINHLSEIEKQL